VFLHFSVLKILGRDTGTQNLTKRLDELLNVLRRICLKPFMEDILKQPYLSLRDFDVPK
jgi:hypothetical protein